MKNPKKQFILFSIAFILALSSVMIVLIKHDFNVTWEDSFPGPLFLNSFLALAMAFQAWRAYKEMKKVV